jgi:chromosome segregation ATPase
MQHKDRAIKEEMLRNEIAEIRANLQSVTARLSNLPAGPARSQFEADLAEMTEELATREKELADVAAGGAGAESAAITREMLEDEVKDLQANVESCEARIKSASGDARKLYESEKAELAEELSARRKDLADLG